MLDPKDCTLFSGGAEGAEACFGECAERHGVREVHFTFPGHRPARTTGLRELSLTELAEQDVSLAYVSRLLKRGFSNAPYMRRVLQSIMHQVESADEVFVVGALLEDKTVKGGTGWGAEFAKLRNKPLLLFDQEQDGWLRYHGGDGVWRPEPEPAVTRPRFAGTGTRFLEANGRRAVEEVFARSFGRAQEPGA
jgi:hypothetical protein